MTPEQQRNYEAARARARAEFPHVHRHITEMRRIDRRTHKWNRAFVDDRRILERRAEPSA